MTESQGGFDSAPDDEIQLISDGEGLAIIGNPAAIELFLVSEGLAARDLGLQRLRSTVGQSAGAGQLGAEIADNAGRWVKMTEKSAALAKRHGLMQSTKSGLSMGVVHAKSQAKGIKGIVQFEKVPGSLAAAVANPAVLAGAAGVMAQIAMQQTMDEIIDYLATIDEKVDDVLRAQKDAVLADMLGVGLVIDEAMTIREQAGCVSEVTWSKVQSTSVAVARTQAYALRQLDALAEKVEHKGQMAEVAKAAKQTKAKAQEWLAVLAHCFQLQDALAILELDRVFGASPEELDQHRVGLRASRQKRRDLILSTTSHLIERMETAAALANEKVLMHPVASREVVDSSRHVVAGVVEFQALLGIENDRRSLDARRWLDAAGEVRDKVLETGSEGVAAAKRLGGQTIERTTDVFRSVDLDGDGIPDQPRALTAMADAGSAITGTTAAALGAAGKLLKRKRETGASTHESDIEPSVD